MRVKGGYDMWIVWLKKEFQTSEHFELKDIDKLQAVIHFTDRDAVQNTIDTWRKRLCRMASQETREYAEDFKRVLREVDPEWSDVLVPNCVYRCGCPEPTTCGWYQKMILKYPAMTSTIIQDRYNAYNEVFYGDN